MELGIHTEDDLPKTLWQRVLAVMDIGGAHYYALDLEEEYRLTQYGVTLNELSLEYQEKYQQQQGMLVTMALAQLGYSATSRALYGPALNPATAYSPDSRLDQIEKTGVDPGNGSAASISVSPSLYSWGNPDTLEDHYVRHGGDVGATSSFDYARKAHGFYENRMNYQIKVDSRGITRVYDPINNIFGSYNPDGTTRTIFAPVDGQAYFDRQPGIRQP